MTDPTEGEWVQSACPSCGKTARRQTYDVGSGPELSCAWCEWCWGAEGQSLKDIPVPKVAAWQTAQATADHYADPEKLEPQGPPVRRTKSGRVLTDAELEGYAGAAECANRADMAEPMCPCPCHHAKSQ
jgi:hypothetical protein